MSYDEKVLRSEYAFSGLEVLLCDMFRRSRAWVWPELLRFSRGRSVVVAGHLNLYRGRVDQRDLLPQRVSSRECGSAMAACVTQFRFVSNNNKSNDLTAPLFPKTKHVCPARRSGTQAHVRWRFGTGISYQVWCLCLNAGRLESFTPVSQSCATVPGSSLSTTPRPCTSVCLGVWVITAARPYPMATKVAQSAPPKSWALRATWGC